LLSIGFCILVAISAASVWSGQDAQAVVTTFDIQNRLSLILLNLRRAESAQRGYIITGQEAYRTEYREAARNTLPAVDTAAKGLDSDPSLKSQFAKIPDLVRRKLDEMERVVALHDSGRTKEAADLIVHGEGRQVMEEIRQTIAALYNAERTQLERRREESAGTNYSLLIVTLLGAIVIALIGGLSVYLVQRTGRQREQARRALAEINDHLEAKIEERTAELREANNEIQRFAYIVSHDLRSPLVNIMGFTAEIESIKKTYLAALRPCKIPIPTMTERR
jgi:hypothetical protein